MRKLLFISLLFVVGGCKVVPVPESTLFQPDKFGKLVDVENLREVNLVKNDSVNINALFLDNAEAEKVVLYLHGNAGSIWGTGSFWFYQELEKIGLDVFTVDYEGFGKSGGKPTVEGLYETAALAYDYLLKTYSKEQIIIWGFSLGTVPSCRLASEGKGHKLILEGCLMNSEEAIKSLKKITINAPARWFVKLKVDNKLTFDPMADIGKVNQAVLMISGEKDEITPMKLAEQVYESIPHDKKEFYRVKGAGHNQTKQARSVYEKVKGFIE